MIRVSDDRLSSMVNNCLHRHGLNPAETASYSDEDLLELRNFGRKSLADVRALYPRNGETRTLELDHGYRTDLPPPPLRPDPNRDLPGDLAQFSRRLAFFNGDLALQNPDTRDAILFEYFKWLLDRWADD